MIKIDKKDKLEEIIMSLGKNIVDFKTKILDIEYITNYKNKKNNSKKEIKEKKKLLFLGQMKCSPIYHQLK